MKTHALVIPCIVAAFALAGCSSTPATPATTPQADSPAPPLPAGQVALDAQQHQGKKLRVSGIYKQGYSNGGRPEDPWVLVIGDEPASTKVVRCEIPTKVEIPGRYPKIVAEGTLKGTGDEVMLEGCTYTIEP